MINQRFRQGVSNFSTVAELRTFDGMENTANVGLFAVHRIVSKYAERIYTYIEKAQRDSWHREYAKIHISGNNNTNFNF